MKSLIRKFGEYLINISQPTDEVVMDPVEKAVYDAYLSVGLNQEQYSHDFDLLRANKLAQVYHVAARNLKVEPELNTVGDVIKWLSA